VIEYRDAERADATALTEMAQRSFVETFAHLYGQADLEGFIADAFGPSGLPSHVGAPGYAIRLALEDGAIAGFAKLGKNSLPAPAAVELKQLYVLGAWQGRGVAAALMEWALATARAQGARTMVLGVFAGNVRAQRFYARYGFAEIGRNPFRVGQQIDDDRIWSVKL